MMAQSVARSYVGPVRGVGASSLSHLGAGFGFHHL